MSRLTWNAPERRFFETGLDRGVLFPKGTPPTGEIVGKNLAVNPRGLHSTGIYEEVKRNLVGNPRTPGMYANNTQWNSVQNSPVPVPHPLGFTHGSYAWRDPATFPTESPNAMASMYNLDGMAEWAGTPRYLGAFLLVTRKAVVTLSTQTTDATVTKTLEPNQWTWFATPKPGLGWSGLNAFTFDGLAAQAADRVWVSGLIASRQPTSYFDGDYPDSNNFQYAWAGAPNGSESIASALGATNWYQMNGSTVTREQDGGVNFRNGLGSGMYLNGPTPEGSAGRYYSARYKVRRILGEPSTPGFQMTTPLYDGDSYIAVADWDGDTSTLPEDGSFRTVNVLATEPSSTANTPALFFYANTGTHINFHVTDVQIEEVEGPGMPVPNAYFDGSSTSGAFTFVWTGTVNNSPSTKREILTFAVPWDGLTSVEESGGEGARAYYVDGRPFLFLPMPKEYKATLNAYTYPDAFSAIMGLAEVTDGMYLDSQPGQSFDLAYRTLVGNAAEGQDHGYKIHLVYNATVTPGAVNYETLSDSVNPSTMSWEIQAVPVRVEGFRPTAHIVIDTRHMDQHKIDAIEELLYGSENEVAHMPPPQLVFDILNYGDTIVVTDNGDGTFDVEGSYENVYLVGDGEFRLENIDGQNNGDGTFTISTTEG